MSNGKLRYEVRRMFENTATDDFQCHRKAGSLDSRAFSRIDSGRVFKQRRESAGVDSAVVILFDVSSSMTDNVHSKGVDLGPMKMREAVKTCAALLETLSAAQVATAVVTFDNYSSILQPFGSSYRKTLPLLQRLNPSGSTNDYFALRFSHQMLLRRPEARRVCFVLTDGMGNEGAARKQVASGAALGITTIGIGMCTDVSRVYPSNVMVNDMADLGRVAFSKIKMSV